MKKSILIPSSFVLALCFTEALAQGCVAIRGFSGCSAGLSNTFGTSKGEAFISTSFRYFKSFRHFRGNHEEIERIENGTEVINKSYFLDLSLTYGITNRLYATAILPFTHHNRSSMYEHGGNPPNGLGERHETTARGLSDLRLGMGYWLIDPSKGKSFNYAIGVGIKLPTGNYDYKDTFYNQGVNKNETNYAVVDQSIQPGDGGTGITLDVQGYHVLSEKFVLSTNLFYLINPKETNGILTRSKTSEFSCPDQFAIRMGSFYNTSLHGFSMYAGGRVEGVPSTDLVGGSAGYRRPGYAISIEPGIAYSKNNIAINASIPFAVARNRVQSYQDKQISSTTGVYKNGDAAFADYLVNITLTYRIGKKHGDDMLMDFVPDWND
ncbi:transporter [Reichenbachiella carrageenanivorans]|uniref:Transporter n=1 Tax=Reichenbachiella carrageenanivorans TaxID=2979869 RepID=A0ABY6D6E4_9BACT|nr:transporter [Reichenbachiella carrageenanivorans]UXX80718.1 transporter [Reichenbachiella carrageenanivorans]